MRTENTLVNTGSASAPGAGADVAQIADVPSGIYEVEVIIALTGTAETSLRNLRLREGGRTIADNLPTLSGLGGPIHIKLPRVEVNPDAADDLVDLDVIAIAAATAGAVYNVVILATRIG